ncbi:hypothetical protein IscW_ISCW015125 [Ixodes scapularis]|uniref:Uncharacterized protein n=1 Tax=Ixodes scapularis TaxID=6945 RepID=B7QNC7_IXOSC|nr:hypothetical protein IscW_ISCW015125 [Ixodes scapularis]|eukprot:XP_002416432.1 hypothetical protein IscW_ISCW015125 [Ixodes scapularis]
MTTQGGTATNLSHSAKTKTKTYTKGKAVVEVDIFSDWAKKLRLGGQSFNKSLRQ